MISQALKQHGIESRGANDLAYRNAGKAFVYDSPINVPALLQQKFGVILETENEIVYVIGKFDIAIVAEWQVRIGFADLFRLRRPHSIGINVVPFDFYF